MKKEQITNGITLVLLSAFPAFAPCFAAAADSVTPAACDIQKSPCVQRTAGGMTVEFDIQPKPVTAMSDLQFIVKLEQQGKPVPDAEVDLKLSMPGMFMGRNQPLLKHTSRGQYEGTGIITRCMSGRKTWQADISVGPSPAETVSFLFEVQ